MRSTRGSPLVVVTAHRRENWNGGLGRVAEAIGRLATAHPEVRFIIPLHPNPLVREQLGEPLAAHANVIRTEPLAYAPFARLMSKAAVIVTDSGGIQEEAPALGVPVLVARESTERGEGVDAGTLTLVGTDPDAIVAAAEAVLADPAAHRVDPARNPYGDGLASERIVTALEYISGFPRVPARFGPGFSRRAVLAAAGYPAGLLAAARRRAEHAAGPRPRSATSGWVADRPRPSVSGLAGLGPGAVHDRVPGDRLHARVDERAVRLVPRGAALGARNRTATPPTSSSGCSSSRR